MWPPIYVLQTPQSRRQRIKTTSSYEKCKTLQTQQSVVIPNVYTYNCFPELEANKEFLITPLITKKKQKQQMNQSHSHNSKIEQSQMDKFFREMKLLTFLFKQSSELSKFANKKKQVIKSLTIAIQSKENEVLKQKKHYDRKVKKLKEKKMRMQNVIQALKEIEVKKEVELIVKIKKLKQKLEVKQIQFSQSLFSSEIELREKKNSSKKQRIQIKIPLLIPTQNRCYSCQNYCQTPTHNYAYTQHTQSQSNDYFQESEIDGPKFVKTGKKMSDGKLRTEPSEGFYTRRSSKVDRPSVRYMQDQECEGEKQLKTERSKKKRQQSLIYEVVSTLDPARKKVSPEQIKLEKTKDFLKAKGKEIPKIESESVYGSEEIPSEEDRIFTFEKQDDEMPALLEQSKRKQQFSFQNGLKSIDEDQKPVCKENLQISHIKMPRMQKSSSVSSNQDNLKRSPMKISAIKIDFSDEQSSKISKKSKYNAPNQYHNSWEEDFPEIKEESEELVSLQTTPNNALTPPLTPSNEILQHRKISTPSHSSKHNSGITKLEEDSHEVDIPMKKNAFFDFSENNEGISKIQLNLISKNFPKTTFPQQEDKNELSLKKVQEEDDNLMGITLVGESKISRQKSSHFKQSSVPEISRGSERKEQKIEDSDGFDFDMELGAQSMLLKKKSIENRSNQKNNESEFIQSF